MISAQSPEGETNRVRERWIFDNLNKQRTQSYRIQKFSGELSKEQKRRIKASDENIKEYKDFLKKSKTGIVKILPNPNCDLTVIHADDQKCIEALPIPGMGSWYSFIKKSHKKFFNPDISLIGNKIFVGRVGNSSGLILNLNNTDIDSISLDTQEVRSLLSLPPAKRYSELSQQKIRFNKGFKLEGKFFASATSAKLNDTYVMRSIIYYPYFFFGRRTDFFDDIILTFRIIEIDSEGAITLIWKELKKDSESELKR